jgi:hypothetical protein
MQCECETPDHFDAIDAGDLMMRKTFGKRVQRNAVAGFSSQRIAFTTPPSTRIAATWTAVPPLRSRCLPPRLTCSRRRSLALHRAVRPQPFWASQELVGGRHKIETAAVELDRGNEVLERDAIIRTLVNKVNQSHSVCHRHQASDIGIAVHDESKVGRHHFFPALKPLIHPPAGVGIVFVVH